ncbi:hypothetical protein ALC62_12799 [Cyphomyrmex costatus]|uniref:Uncharacterized protein n=1 Tax=Cyphomyrmex costatus TaxID=456900 RepID=A0A151IB42_9HYME|nr:hypothetical protein ALC62_12799 [Cyphomyrmex costatus]
MGELSCNEVLTSFGLVPNDALEGDGGTGLAGPQTLRFRNGPHAGPNAHVGHVLQHKVRRTIENRKGTGGRVKKGFRLQYGSQASSGDGNKSEVMILKRQRSESMNGEKIGSALICRETMRVQESQNKTRTLRAYELFDLNETQSETKVTEAILRENRLSAVMKRGRETLLRHVSPSSSRKPPRHGIDGSSAWRLLRHRRSPPPLAANTTRSGVTYRGQVGLPLMRRYLKIRAIWIQVGASVFAPFLAALTSTLHDQSCFEAVEWPLYRVGTGEKLESRETPRHATPKQRSGIRRGRCDDAIRASIRLLLFVPAASSGAEPRHADEESRSFSINAPPSRPPLNYTRLVPSVCLPRGRRVFINLHALRCALIVRK